MSRHRSSVVSFAVIAVVSSLAFALVACGGAVDSPRVESSDPSTPAASNPSSSAKGPTTTTSPPVCAAPRCNPGDVTEAGLRLCPPGATCYQRSACGQTVYCTAQLGCGADPACPPGYDRVASCLSSGTPDCTQQVVCGELIACELQCDGDPSCDPGPDAGADAAAAATP